MFRLFVLELFVLRPSPSLRLTPFPASLQAMLGIFFSAKSAVLIEDVPFTEDDIHKE